MADHDIKMRCGACGHVDVLDVFVSTPYGQRVRCLSCGAIQAARVQLGWFNQSGAAAYLGCSPKEVRRLTTNGVLVGHPRRGSKRKWYARMDLDALHVTDAAGGG